MGHASGRRRHSLILPVSGSSQTRPCSVGVVSARGECPRPSARRPRACRGEDAGKSSEQPPVGRTRTNHPNARDAIGLATVDGRSEVGSLGPLSRRASGSSANVSKGVPGLLDDQDSMTRIADAHVDRPRWIGGARRKLEGGCPAGRAGQREQTFLHREVACVGRFASLAERPAERHGQRLTERDAECDPGLKGDALTATELDPADPRLMHIDPCRQLGLRQPMPEAAASDRLAECIGDRLREAVPLADRVGRPPSGR